MVSREDRPTELHLTLRAHNIIDFHLDLWHNLFLVKATPSHNSTRKNVKYNLAKQKNETKRGLEKFTAFALILLFTYKTCSVKLV